MKPCPVVLLFLLAHLASAAPAWHSGLYLGWDGYWRQRCPVTLRNATRVDIAGSPVGIPIGPGKGHLPLSGQDARAVRVCRDDGTELLYGLRDVNDEPLFDGPIPPGSTLIVPAECPGDTTNRLWVYFDNDDAGRVPDHLETGPITLNGGFERRQGLSPYGWTTKDVDGSHRVSLDENRPRSGRVCARTTVAPGAEPNWVAYQLKGLPLIGGARYTLRAWVRARDVKGSTGWFLHINSPEKYMLTTRHLDGGQGSFDWKQLSCTFTAPTNATHATVGTILRGTGTAWFDDLELETNAEAALTAVAGKAERQDLREMPADETGQPADAPGAIRIPLRVTNVHDEPYQQVLACVPLRGSMARHAQQDRIQIRRGTRVLPHAVLDRTLVFPCDVPARTRLTFTAVITPGENPVTAYADVRRQLMARTTPDADASNTGSDIPSDQRLREQSVMNREQYARLLSSPLNRVRNPGFETGTTRPDTWIPSSKQNDTADLAMGCDANALFGKQTARIHVAHSRKPSWIGWRQPLPVKPHRSYLLAGWLKCRDLRGDLTMHAHYHNADGKLCAQNPFTSVPGALHATQDWTLLQGRFTMPGDAATFHLHLTMNTTGTAWHDGLFFAEAVDAVVGRPSISPPTAGDAAIAAWPVNAIVKVFRDDAPPPTPRPARITVARNEKEPLQLAIRSARAYENVAITVDSPRHVTGGDTLDGIDTGVVGYVPIDYPTRYFRSMSPAWHRKVATGSVGCDGWPGEWPDPILPRATMTLEAGRTQAAWITVRVPPDAAAGDYRGRVRFQAGGKTIGTVPFVVHVWDFTLPARSGLAAIYDVRFRSNWSLAGQPSSEQTRRTILRYMADNRIAADRIHASPRFTRTADGEFTADFKQYDTEAHFYFDELDMPFSYTPHTFYVFGWAHPPRPFMGEAPYEGKAPYADADHANLRPAYKRAYQACLKKYWDHVTARGWADRIVLYISDEPFLHEPHIEAQMKAVCEMIHAVDPAIPIYSSTWRHCAAWDGQLDVWGVGHYGCFPVETMQARLAAGDRLWFTTDGQMCTDTPYCAVERMLPYYCFAHGAEAYEFWGLTWLTYDPYRYGWHRFIRQSSTPGEYYHVRYPNGDGFLLYPGEPIGHDGPVTSLRFEQAREGVEDYEYLCELRKRMDNAAARGQDVTQARELLALVDRLCAIPNAGGRYSSRILPEPDTIPVLKEAMAREIETLKP